MAVDVRFLGQSCFELKAGGTTVLTDPFLTGNPLAGATAHEGGPGVHLLTSGGPVVFDWGWVKLGPAWHTAVSPKGTAHAPAGLLIHIGDRLIYHLGDTCLFSDMQLIAQRGDKVDLALVPIGGHYTMDRFDAVSAVSDRKS